MYCNGGGPELSSVEFDIRILDILWWEIFTIYCKPLNNNNTLIAAIATLPLSTHPQLWTELFTFEPKCRETWSLTLSVGTACFSPL